MIPIILIQFISVIYAKSPLKCYLNQTFSTGITEICPKAIPYCCYDLIQTYYCCEEMQLITVLKNGSAVIGFFLLWVIIITSFFCFCVQIQSIGERFEIQDNNTCDVQNAKNLSMDHTFSTQMATVPHIKQNKDKSKDMNKSTEKIPLIMKDKTPEETQKSKSESPTKQIIHNNKKPITNVTVSKTPSDENKIADKSKSPEEVKKPTTEPSMSTQPQTAKLEKIKDYKPAWGKYTTSQEKGQSQKERINFKEKTKSPTSPESIKAILSPTSANCSPQSAKSPEPSDAEEKSENPKTLTSAESSAVDKKKPIISEGEQEGGGMRERVKVMQKLLNPSKLK